ncbi:MAG: PfkB family carbohydrate kinase [Defluviitaleaceae bacterium]|nr:PfkB family carbohydrate kinase [Defluviitaleaceae bacterium]
MTRFPPLSRTRLVEILDKIKDVSVAVFGDLCIDIYWDVDMRMSELSRETPHFAMPVVGERISLGGGGNVAANLAALLPKQAYACGLIGDDWRGRELIALCKAADIDTSHIVCGMGLISNAFCKPMRRGISSTIYEDPRLDFANVVPYGQEIEGAMIKALDAVATKADVLCISDQLPTNVYGAVTPRVREHILKLAASGLTVVADSRDRIGEYKNVILKPNEVEGARAAGLPAAGNINEYAQAAAKLSAMQKCEVVMTIGADGSLYAFEGSVTHVPAFPVPGDIDICGAGDSFISGFSLAIAAGASRPEAAFFAGLCSGVTIQKIGATGTATAEEVLGWFDKCK